MQNDTEAWRNATRNDTEAWRNATQTDTEAWRNATRNDTEAWRSKNSAELKEIRTDGKATRAEVTRLVQRPNEAAAAARLWDPRHIELRSTRAVPFRVKPIDISSRGVILPRPNYEPATLMRSPGPSKGAVQCAAVGAKAYTTPLHGIVNICSKYAPKLLSRPMREIVDHAVQEVAAALPTDGCLPQPRAGCTIFVSGEDDFTLGLLTDKSTAEVKALAARQLALSIPLADYAAAFEALNHTTRAAATAMRSPDILQVSMRYMSDGMMLNSGVTTLDPVDAMIFRKSNRSLRIFAKRSKQDAKVRVLTLRPTAAAERLFTAAEHQTLDRQQVAHETCTMDQAGAYKSVMSISGYVAEGVSGTTLLAVDTANTPAVAYPIGQVLAQEENNHQVYFTAYDPFQDAVAAVCDIIAHYRVFNPCPSGQEHVIDLLSMHAVDAAQTLRELRFNLLIQLSRHASCGQQQADVDFAGSTTEVRPVRVNV